MTARIRDTDVPDRGARLAWAIATLLLEGEVTRARIRTRWPAITRQTLTRDISALRHLADVELGLQVTAIRCGVRLLSAMRRPDSPAAAAALSTQQSGGPQPAAETDHA